MNLQPEDVVRRLPNTFGLVREMRDLIEVILKRAAQHCMSGVALEEWDAINDQLVASHVKHKLETIAAGFVYIKEPLTAGIPVQAKFCAHKEYNAAPNPKHPGLVFECRACGAVAYRSDTAKLEPDGPWLID